MLDWEGGGVQKSKLYIFVKRLGWDWGLGLGTGIAD